MGRLLLLRGDLGVAEDQVFEVFFNVDGTVPQGLLLLLLARMQPFRLIFALVLASLLLLPLVLSVRRGKTPY